MGREKTTSKRFVRNPLRNTKQQAAQRATLASMSSLAPQQRDTPHQGPADYVGYAGYESYGEHEQSMDDAAHTDEDSGLQDTPYGTKDVGDLTHERARELIVAQTTQLLPPAEANALADHLLICDACYRFAQDVAAQRRNAHASQ
ncbi:MAG TPA: hypothetical protein VMV29_07685 [Ktedonobacterales bacterium]|nr:hypothetical protein [Ktedonobacterales bacterium]